MQEQPLSYCPFDYSLNLNKVTFPDSELQLKCLMNEERGLITDVSVSYSIALILSISIDTSDNGNKSSLALRYFDLR